MTYASIKEWIPLNRTLSPTAGTTALNNTLVAEGADIKNLGQGREIGELPLLQETIAEEFSAATKFTNSKYNDPADALRKVSAAWMRRIMGVDTSKDTSFVLQELGREGLNQAFRLIAKLKDYPKNGKILVPDSSWPMISEQLDDYNLVPVAYTMEKGQYATNIEKQLAIHGDSILAVYINSPHNPTGQILTSQDFREIFAVLDAYNANKPLALRIGIIMDNPYAHACKQIMRREHKGLDVGVESFTQETITPWIMPISASKFFGTAEPGFTMIAAHKDYAKYLSARFTRTTALSFFSPFFKALTRVLSPEKDSIVLEYFAGLAKKYADNRHILETVMPSFIVAGDPGMTALIKIDPKTFLGRTMSRNDGSDFPISNLNDVIEYLANKHGVATVNNGGKDGFALLRLAAAAVPTSYAEGIARLKTGLAEIDAAPLRDLRIKPVMGEPDQKVLGS